MRGERAGSGGCIVNLPSHGGGGMQGRWLEGGYTEQLRLQTVLKTGSVNSF